jgi:hypothetical protein
MVSRTALPRPKTKDYVPGVQESLQDAFPSTFLSSQGSKTKQSWFHHAFHHSGFARSRCPSIHIWDHWHGKWRFSATNLIRQNRCDNVHIFGRQKENWKTHDLSQSLAKAKDRRLSARASFFGPHTFQCRSFALCLGGKMCQIIKTEWVELHRNQKPGVRMLFFLLTQFNATLALENGLKHVNTKNNKKHQVCQPKCISGEFRCQKSRLVGTTHPWPVACWSIRTEHPRGLCASEWLIRKGLPLRSHLRTRGMPPIVELAALPTLCGQVANYLHQFAEAGQCFVQTWWKGSWAGGRVTSAYTQNMHKARKHWKYGQRLVCLQVDLMQIHAGTHTNNNIYNSDYVPA